MDINQVLNELIAALVPLLNQALPKYIVSQDLDPWASVTSDTETLGTMDLVVCKASVKASYSIKNMVGLSSVVVTSMTLATFDIIEEVITADTTQYPEVTGTLNLAAKLNKDLTAKLSGKLTAGCDGLSESASISGTTKATSVKGTGKASFTASLVTPQSCFTQVKLSSLKFTYGSITADIDGLGVFNDFLKPLEDAISELFKDEIAAEMATALTPVFNDLLADELPLCVPTSDS